MDMMAYFLGKQATGGASGTQVQADWNTNDSLSKSYIQNRPFYSYEEYVEDLVFPEATELYAPTNADGDYGYALLGYKMELIHGETYEYEVTQTTNSSAEPLTTILTTIVYKATELFPELEEMENKDDWEKVMVLWSTEVSYPLIIAGACFTDINNSFEDIRIVDDTMYYTGIETSDPPSLIVTLKAYNGIQKTFKKIPKVYLPEDIGSSYTLPVATSDILGGVMPVTKTYEMTRPVGIDNNGRLWVHDVDTDTDTFTLTSLSSDAGNLSSPARHPVYRSSNNKLYASLVTAQSDLIGGVKIEKQRTATSYDLPCFVNNSGTIYATAPTGITEITTKTSQLVTEQAVYDYVATQINAIYADLEEGVY